MENYMVPNLWRKCDYEREVQMLSLPGLLFMQTACNVWVINYLWKPGMANTISNSILKLSTLQQFGKV